MKTEIAEEAAKLIKKIKVAKIQMQNFKNVTDNDYAIFGRKDNQFSIGEDTEEGNGKLIKSLKECAINHLQILINELETELHNL